MALQVVRTMVKLVQDKTVYFQGCDGVSKLGVKMAEGSFGIIAEVRQTTTDGDGDVHEYLVTFELPAIGMVFEILCAPHEVEEL